MKLRNFHTGEIRISTNEKLFLKKRKNENAEREEEKQNKINKNDVNDVIII